MGGFSATIIAWFVTLYVRCKLLISRFAIGGAAANARPQGELPLELHTQHITNLIIQVLKLAGVTPSDVKYALDASGVRTDDAGASDNMTGFTCAEYFMKNINISNITSTVTKNAAGSISKMSRDLFKYDDALSRLVRELLPAGTVTTEDLKNQQVRTVIFVITIMRQAQARSPRRSVAQVGLGGLTMAAKLFAFFVLAKVVIDVMFAHSFLNLASFPALSTATTSFVATCMYIPLTIGNSIGDPLKRRFEDNACAAYQNQMLSFGAQEAVSSFTPLCRTTGTVDICDGNACRGEVEPCSREHLLSHRRAATENSTYVLTREETTLMPTDIFALTTGSALLGHVDTCEVMDIHWISASGAPLPPLRSTPKYETLLKVPAAVIIMLFLFYFTPRCSSATHEGACPPAGKYKERTDTAPDVSTRRRAGGAVDKPNFARIKAIIDDASLFESLGAEPGESRVRGWGGALRAAMDTCNNLALVKLLEQTYTRNGGTLPIRNFFIGWPQYEPLPRDYRYDQAKPASFALAHAAGALDGVCVETIYDETVKVSLALMHIATGSPTYSGAEVIDDALLDIRWRHALRNGGAIDELHAILIKVAEMWEAADRLNTTDDVTAIASDDLHEIRIRVRAITAAATQRHGATELFRALRGSPLKYARPPSGGGAKKRG